MKHSTCLLDFTFKAESNCTLSEICKERYQKICWEQWLNLAKKGAIKLGDNLALWTNDFAFSEKSYACIMQEALFWSQQAQFRSSVAFFHQVSHQQMKHLTSWLDFTFKRQRQIELLQKVAKNDTKKFFLET